MMAEMRLGRRQGTGVLMVQTGIDQGRPVNNYYLPTVLKAELVAI